MARKKPARQEPARMNRDEPNSVLPSSTSVSTATTTARRRQGPSTAAASSNQKMRNDEGETLPTTTTAAPSSSSWATRNQWIVLAVASGACAAFNGVFAKLYVYVLAFVLLLSPYTSFHPTPLHVFHRTTNNLTTQIAEVVSGVLGLSNMEQPIEYVVRAIFFGLNLVFNGVMWTLFTKALACGSSTTQVSIMNTSANFVITAVLGFAIFAESLPPLWWLGAALLVAGNVIIGRKDEGAGGQDDAAAATTAAVTEEESSSEQPLLGRQQQPRYGGDGDAANAVAAGIAASGVAAIGAAAQVDESLPRVEKDDEDEDVAIVREIDPDEI
ncbi:hypothetical protein PG994_000106 [Apiospora phragmitis]|uniref:Transmembrane protein 42 n=1 Tax=Apiospora phragmitis TaxID=2905665 RepID=A0ABR1X5C7_9PEZI